LPRDSAWSSVRSTALSSFIILILALALVTARPDRAAAPGFRSGGAWEALREDEDCLPLSLGINTTNTKLTAVCDGPPCFAGFAGSFLRGAAGIHFP